MDQVETKEEANSWPAWFYGPEAQSQVFASEDQVPEGWVDHPSKLGKTKKTPPLPSEPVESPYKDMTDAEVVQLVRTRKLEHGDKWPRVKLEQLLLDDDAADAADKKD